MPLSLSLINDLNAWKNYPQINKDLCHKVITSVISLFSLHDSLEIEISVLLTNNARMQELNKQFLDQDKPTNVLSFPDQEIDRQQLLEKGINGNYIYLGDIAMGYEIMTEESNKSNISLENHFIHLLVHGILHLLGYDHDTNEKTLEMRGLEIKVLNEFGIQTPY